MSEKIKLKVSGAPPTEFVSQGNFHAELAPDSTVETTSREFADFLIVQYGLTEIHRKTKHEKPEKVNQFAVGYAENFPGRDALVGAEIPFDSARGLSREQLLKIPGIGAATADQILGFTSEPPAVPQPGENTPPSASDGDAEGETTEVNSNDAGGEI